MNAAKYCKIPKENLVHGSHCIKAYSQDNAGLASEQACKRLRPVAHTWTHVQFL